MLMRRNADQLQLDRRRRTHGTIAIATFALRRVAAWPGGGAPRYTLGRVCRCLIMPASRPAKEEALLIVTPESVKIYRFSALIVQDIVDHLPSYLLDTVSMVHRNRKIFTL